ncbi:MAG: PrsW family intramembrane metalloprotease [Anaerolineales bacterium]|nr:PrsW family intramembrane metalloprotease [Anaerolineales bacterium]
MGVIISLFLGVIPAFVYATFVYWLDRYEKEPVILLGGVFIWGAVVAAGGAFIINTLFGISVFLVTGDEAATDFATASISAPLVEETLKGLAVLSVFLAFRREFDSILDGIVYAGIAALGFAATENSYYIFSYGYQESGVEGVLILACIRNIIVGWQHPFYTAFIGIGLAVARLNRNMLVKLAAPVAGWTLAVLTHSFHNTFAGMAGDLIGDVEGFFLGSMIDWTGWFFMFVLILVAIFREQHYLKTYLREEVTQNIITKQQYDTACSAFLMSLARMNSLFSGQYGNTHKFYHLCAELAHKKRQRDAVGEERGNSVLIRKIQSELAQLSPHVRV